MNDYDEIVEDELLEGDEDLEDNPLYDALNDDPTDTQDTDEEDEDSEFEPADGDSVEVLKTKLAAKSRILRQRGKSNSRLKDELDALKAQVESGNGGLDKQDIADIIAASKVDGNVDTEKQEQERLDAMKEQLEEDPTAIVDILNSTNNGLENKLAKILQQRDQYWEEKLANATRAQAPEESPEVMRTVERLRQKEGYKDLDEATLITFAKDLAPLGGRVKGNRPPASTTGRGALPANAKNEQVEKRYASELDRMGYGSDND